MAKTELISEISQKTALSKKDSESALNSIIDAISSALVNGDKVQLTGFGIFGVKERAERIGRNPRTKEETTIPAF